MNVLFGRLSPCHCDEGEQDGDDDFLFHCSLRFIHRLKSYRFFIQVTMISRTSGAKVSSMSLYSDGLPVLQCWNRWLTPSMAWISF